MKKRVSMSELAAVARSQVACPRCGCVDFRVYGVKRYDSSTLAMRYKECRNCGHKLITMTRTDEKIIRSVYE